MTLGAVAGFLPYVFIFVWILSPKTILALYRWLNPTRSYSGWAYSDWFMRLIGIGFLIFCVILQVRAKLR